VCKCVWCVCVSVYGVCVCVTQDFQFLAALPFANFACGFLCCWKVLETLTTTTMNMMRLGNCGCQGSQRREEWELEWVGETGEQRWDNVLSYLSWQTEKLIELQVRHCRCRWQHLIKPRSQVEDAAYDEKQNEKRKAENRKRKTKSSKKAKNLKRKTEKQSKVCCFDDANDSSVQFS